MNINFTNNTFTQDQNELLSKLANSSDSDLQKLASHQARQDFDTSPTRKTTKVVGSAIPFVDSFLKGATTKGDFATKTLSGLDTGKDWGIFVVVTKAYNYLLNKAINKSPRLKKFAEEHPTITFVTSLITGVTVGNAGIKYINKAIQKGFNLPVDTKNPGQTPIVSALNKKYGERLNKLPIADFMQNKVFKPIENFAKKPAAKYLATATMFGIGALIIKNIYDVYSIKKNANKNYNNLTNIKANLNKDNLNQVA
jgi:hypothetical protein